VYPLPSARIEIHPGPTSFPKSSTTCHKRQSLSRHSLSSRLVLSVSFKFNPPCSIGSCRADDTPAMDRRPDGLVGTNRGLISRIYPLDDLCFSVGGPRTKHDHGYASTPCDGAGCVGISSKAGRPPDRAHAGPLAGPSCLGTPPPRTVVYPSPSADPPDNSSPPLALVVAQPTVCSNAEAPRVSTEDES